MICIINNVFVVDYDTNNNPPPHKAPPRLPLPPRRIFSKLPSPYSPIRTTPSLSSAHLLPISSRRRFRTQYVTSFFLQTIFSIECFQISHTPQVDFIAGMHRLPRLPASSSSSSSSLNDFHLESTPHVCHLLHLLQFKSLTLRQVLRKRYNVSKVSRYLSQISPDNPSYTNQHVNPQVGSASNNSQAVFAALGQHFTQVSASLFHYCIRVSYLCRTFDRICCSWILMNFGR